MNIRAIYTWQEPSAPSWSSWWAAWKQPEGEPIDRGSGSTEAMAVEDLVANYDLPECNSGGGS